MSKEVFIHDLEYYGIDCHAGGIIYGDKVIAELKEENAKMRTAMSVAELRS